MLATPLNFPADIPKDYEMLVDEPVYDPAIHLAPDESEGVVTESLADFGYSQDEITLCPSPIAVGGPFRVFSKEGIRATTAVLSRLRSTAESDTGNRAPNYVAGGVYKSKFLRDLSNCTVLAERVSTIMGTPLGAHSIPHQQLYINFAPEDVTKAVDNWHIDSIDYDIVILLEDPDTFEGGKFQYFRGTDHEAAEIFGTETDELPLGFADELPENQVVSAAKTQGGEAVCMQGAKVVHRAQKLAKAAERTTLVISYVPLDVKFRDQNNLQRIIEWDHSGTAAELARHCAWRSQARLNSLLKDLSINAEEDSVLESLKFAVADVNKLIELMEAG